MAKRVGPRVLACSARYDGFRKVISDNLISERVPIVAAISCGPLTEFGSRISCLANTGERSRENKRGIIKAVLSGEPKLILKRQATKLRVVPDSAIVLDYPKAALGVLTLPIVPWHY